MPDVQDQDRARLSTPVPGFMLETVVEDEALALFPFARLVADPDRAISRQDQRQVHGELVIAQAEVWGDVRPGLEDGEEHFGSMARDPGERQLLHESGRGGASVATLLDAITGTM